MQIVEVVGKWILGRFQLESNPNLIRDQVEVWVNFPKG